MFFLSPERVASLIVKITNQVIRSCKRYITENGNLTIWAQARLSAVKDIIPIVIILISNRKLIHS